MENQEIKVRDLIRKSFKTAGIIGTGEVPSGEESNDAFYLLNSLVATFNNENMFFPFSILRKYDASKEIEVLSRPSLGFDSVFFSSGSQSKRELVAITASEYEYNNKQKVSYPNYYYYDANFDKPTLFILPYPQSGFITTIQSGSFKGFDNLDEIISLPAGFNLFLQYQLATLLCPEYGREPNQLIAGKAISLKSTLKETLEQQKVVRFYGNYDNGCHTYDIFSGD